MPTSLLFGEKLQQRLGPLLERAGFERTWLQSEPIEAIVYERESPSGQKDEVGFHGLEHSYVEQHIYADAVSGSQEHTFLKTLKELLPNYASLQYPEQSRWTYRDTQELEVCLDEIAEVVEGRLLAWFENPINNPAGLDTTSPISEEGRRKQLERTIEKLAKLAKQARVEGRTHEAEEHERAAELCRKELFR